MEGVEKMKNKEPSVLILFLFAAGLSACSMKKPVLYPNDHLNAVGKTQAKADIEACMEMAKESGVNPERTEKVAGRSAAGATIGAITGLAVGAVLGDSGKNAMAGAVGGGTGGCLSGIFESSDPDPLFKNFVERCLQEKGYSPVGWR